MDHGYNTAAIGSIHAACKCGKFIYTNDNTAYLAFVRYHGPFTGPCHEPTDPDDAADAHDLATGPDSAGVVFL